MEPNPITDLCNELGVGPEMMLEMAATHGSDSEVILSELRRLKLDRALANANALSLEIIGMGGGEHAAYLQGKLLNMVDEIRMDMGAKLNVE